MPESVRAAVADQLASIGGVIEGQSAFGPGPAWWAGGKEIAHFDSPDTMDIRMTRSVIRARRAEFRADHRVTLRPSSSSDWIEVRVVTADVGWVADLVATAAEVHSPPADSPPAPPPTGTDLARRRRFH